MATCFATVPTIGYVHVLHAALSGIKRPTAIFQNSEVCRNRNRKATRNQTQKPRLWIRQPIGKHKYPRLRRPVNTDDPLEVLVVLGKMMTLALVSSQWSGTFKLTWLAVTMQTKRQTRARLVTHKSTHRLHLQTIHRKPRPKRSRNKYSLADRLFTRVRNEIEIRTYDYQKHDFIKIIITFHKQMETLYHTLFEASYLGPIITQLCLNQCN